MTIEKGILVALVAAVLAIGAGSLGRSVARSFCEVSMALSPTRVALCVEPLVQVTP